MDISASRLFHWHVVLIGLLALAHFLSALAVVEADRGRTLWTLFSMGGEANIPSFVSAVALLLCAVVALLLVAGDAPANRVGWRLVAILLLFMAVDEAARLHEQLKWFSAREAGQLSLFWMLPYGAVLLGAVLILFPFWLRLPVPTRLGLAAAAVLFVGAAMGMELVESRLHASRPDDRLALPLVLSVLVEEVLEMLAVALALTTMLRHMAAGRAPSLSLVR